MNFKTPQFVISRILDTFPEHFEGPQQHTNRMYSPTHQHVCACTCMCVCVLVFWVCVYRLVYFFISWHQRDFFLPLQPDGAEYAENWGAALVWLVSGDRENNPWCCAKPLCLVASILNHLSTSRLMCPVYYAARVMCRCPLRSPFLRLRRFTHGAHTT